MSFNRMLLSTLKIIDSDFMSIRSDSNSRWIHTRAINTPSRVVICGQVDVAILERFFLEVLQVKHSQLA
jgi:hypothetical protein